jgi:hypothetical protein
MHFCPNCSAEVGGNAPGCNACKADFSDPAGWKPKAAPAKPSKRWHASSLIIFYGIVGPILGAFLLSMWLLLPASVSGFHGFTMNAVLGILVLPLFGCFQHGGLPAVMTGLTHALLGRKFQSRWKNILTIAIAAGVFQYIYSIALATIVSSTSGTALPFVLGPIHLIAALSAAILAALVTRQERIEA